MRILSPIKNIAFTTALSLSAVAYAQKPNYAPPLLQTLADTFEYQNISQMVSPKGVNNLFILEKAPNPFIEIAGEEKTASIIVDINRNILYKYDEEGNAVNAFLIASGKASTPTETGVRIVTHIERYPYKTAPKHTKRRKSPWDYGPRIICLNKIDPQTGTQSSTGEFIHGNNNPKSLGKHASKGCIRMDNEIIKQIATETKQGDIVIIQ